MYNVIPKKMGVKIFLTKKGFFRKNTLTTFPLSFRPGLAPRAKSSTILISSIIILIDEKYVGYTVEIVGTSAATGHGIHEKHIITVQIVRSSCSM